MKSLIIVYIFCSVLQFHNKLIQIYTIMMVSHYLKLAPKYFPQLLPSLKYNFSSSDQVIKTAYEQLNKLSQYKQAELAKDKLCYIDAIHIYRNILNILQSAQLNNSLQHKITYSKLIACQFLTQKYQQILNNAKQQQQLPKLNQTHQNKQLSLFTEFILLASNKIVHSDENPRNEKVQGVTQSQLIQLRQIISILFTSKQNTDTVESSKDQSMKLLRKVALLMNNRLNYKKILQNLVERQLSSQNKVTLQELKKDLSIDQQNAQNKQSTPVSPNLELIYHLCCTFDSNFPFYNKEVKQFSNVRINSILQSYQEIYQNAIPSQRSLIYQPLINLTLNLIVQKHYMSAEGIIGHIKSGSSGLFIPIHYSGSKQNQTNQLQDHNLANNIYRMLVTRANNQQYQEGWKKEKQFKAGLFVAERIALQGVRATDFNSLKGLFV